MSGYTILNLSCDGEIPDNLSDKQTSTIGDPALEVLVELAIGACVDHLPASIERHQRYCGVQHSDPEGASHTDYTSRLPPLHTSWNNISTRCWLLFPLPWNQQLPRQWVLLLLWSQHFLGIESQKSSVTTVHSMLHKHSGILHRGMALGPHQNTFSLQIHSEHHPRKHTHVHAYVWLNCTVFYIAKLEVPPSTPREYLECTKGIPKAYLERTISYNRCFNFLLSSTVSVSESSPASQGDLQKTLTISVKWSKYHANSCCQLSVNIPAILPVCYSYWIMDFHTKSRNSCFNSPENGN